MILPKTFIAIQTDEEASSFGWPQIFCVHTIHYTTYGNHPNTLLFRDPNAELELILTKIRYLPAFI